MWPETLEIGNREDDNVFSRIYTLIILYTLSIWVLQSCLSQAQFCRNEWLDANLTMSTVDYICKSINNNMLKFYMTWSEQLHTGQEHVLSWGTICTPFWCHRHCCRKNRCSLSALRLRAPSSKPRQKSVTLEVLCCKSRTWNHRFARLTFQVQNAKRMPKEQVNNIRWHDDIRIRLNYHVVLVHESLQHRKPTSEL
jgi:hypothetical protein